MKKFVLSTVLLVLLSGFVLAAVSTETALQYNSNTRSVTLNFSRGWNMAPVGEGVTNTADPQDPDYCKNATSIFIWDPVSKQYLGGRVNNSGVQSADTQQATDAINSAKEAGYAFGSMGAAWAYLANPCKMTMQFSGNALTGEKGRKILKGWNFIAIMPWMLNKKFADIAGDCTITKANTWADNSQSWSQQSSSAAAQTLMSQLGTPIREMDIGNTLVIYAQNDCELSQSLVPQNPPTLPP